ncbi:PREDICTED: aspartic proteinase A2-like [Camelina sativa]|uniref:Aspartic proteinase A2-like n=1 Tax=Camelina sativa TaxID=90675 RepID=A0ABM0UTV7_CAMSA|nr:PREDICTED: aspartic proteinase A2-like [Camelina sativa]
MTPNDVFANVAYDGILGLGFPKWAVKDTVTVLENIDRQKPIKRKIFSFWLTSNGGVLMFGGYNQEHIQEDHTYVPVITRPNKDFWKIRMSTILIGQEPTEHCVPHCTAIIDSGTTDIIGPQAAIKDINLAVGAFGNGGVVPCSTVDKLPIITFTIGKKAFPLGPREYIAEDNSICFTRFVPDSGSRWFLGIAFMRRYHTVFDFEDMKTSDRICNCSSSITA